jgi:Uma2 family endonuclease
MSLRTRHGATAEDLLNAPAELGSCELVRGALIVMSPGKGRHGAVGARIARALGNFVDAHRLGEVFDSSTGYVLARDPDTVREPDVSFVCAARLMHQDLDAFLEGAPDLAVEILSPGNSETEMRQKMADYWNAGCRVVWIVDPSRRSVTVWRRETAPVVFAEQDILREDEVLPGFSVCVRDFFPAA